MSHSWGLRINRAKEMLSHMENNLHLLCHYYISCEHFRSGCDREKPTPKPRVMKNLSGGQP